MSFHTEQPLGAVYFHNNKTWRRGRGIIYVAHPSSPFLTKKYLGRKERRKRKKVSPSTSRFNRRRHHTLDISYEARILNGKVQKGP